jgi:mono/diheme cytochrome c family protein
MSRTVINVVIDLIAALLLLGMIATGYLLRFPLPPGSNKTHVLWGLTRHQWGDVHFWISLGLLLVMLIHLALHWNWIVTVIGKRCHLLKTAQPSLTRSAVWTVAIATALCVGFAWLAETDVVEQVPAIRGGGQMHQRLHGRSQDAADQRQETAASGQLIWSDVYPIFAKNCLACHGPRQQAASFRVDAFESFFGAGGNPPLIMPGQSSLSPLVAIISGQRPEMAMAEIHKLPEKEVARIRTWIDQGAEPKPNLNKAP